MAALEHQDENQENENIRANIVFIIEDTRPGQTFHLDEELNVIICNE